MPAIRIDTPIALSNDHLVDLVMLQWHTPLPNGPRCFAELSAATKALRQREISKLLAWLVELDATQPSRPLFVIAPEVSLPHEFIDEIKPSLRNLRRQCVFIAGLSHLSWPNYVELVNACPDMPSDVDWTQGGGDGMYINAAVVLIFDSNPELTPKQYLQLKTHPYADEAQLLYPSRHSLVFQSQNRSQGARLDFSVNICSDFVNPDIVEAYRRDIALADADRRVDLTFVLQWQPDPDAEQFRTCTRTFYSPPVGMVDTSSTALLFLNNAGSHLTEPASFGGSRMNVKFGQAYRISDNAPHATYYANKFQAYNHQALILRENLPCIYWSQFKPIYLAAAIAGQEDHSPIDPSLCAYLIDDASPLAFKRLQPVPYWLDRQWAFDEANWSNVIPDTIQDRVTLTNYLQGIHRNMRNAWSSEMSQRQVEAREMMQTFTELIKEEPNTPSTEGEPTRWGQSSQRAARRLMRLLTTIRIGLPTLSITFPHPINLRHALIQTQHGHKVNVSFLWGNGDRSPVSMLGSFQSRLTASGGLFIGTQTILVLVESQGSLTPETIHSWRQQNITRFSSPETGAAESITDATPTFGAISSDFLLNQIETAKNSAELEDTLKVHLESLIQ